MATDATEKFIGQLRRMLHVGEGGQSDAHLLGRFIDGRDEAAFELLLRRHGPMVLGVCRRLLSNPQDADDAFQATFLVLVRKAASIRSRELLGNWLYGVARQTALRARSLIAQRQRRERQVIVMPEPRTSAANSSVDWQDALDHELSRLPEKYRIAIVLCDLEGKSATDAARQLGWPVGSLTGRLSKGRALLASRLAKSSGPLSAALVAVELSRSAAPAQLPSALVSSTMAAIGALASGQALKCGIVSATVVALTEGMVRTMLLTKLRIVSTVVVIALTGGGIGALSGWRTLAGQTPPDMPKSVKSKDAEPPAVARAGEAASGPRVDMHGDPLPEGAVSRLGTIRFNHGGRLNAMFFTPDGKTIISEGSGRVRLWDAASGKELREFGTGESTWDDQTVLLADGKRLMTLRQEFPADKIRVWSLADGKEVEMVQLPVRRGGHDVWHRNALSPDGRFCAISMPKQIRVFEIATVKELWNLPNTENEKGTLVTFAGNGKLITVDHNSVVQIWEAATGKLVREFKHGSKVGFLAATADGTCVATLEHDGYSSDRNLDRGVVHILDLASGKEVQTLKPPPKSGFMRVRFAPDDKTVFASWYTENASFKASSWNLATGEQIAVLGEDIPQAISPDRRIAAIGGAEFELLNLSNNAPDGLSDAKAALARDVFLSSTGGRVVTDGFYSVSEWEVSSGRRSHSAEISQNQSSLPCAAHSSDGCYAAIFEGDYKSVCIIIWDTTARKAIHTLRPPGANQNTRVSFSPDSSLVATYLSHEQGALTIWDVKTGKELRSFNDSKAFAGNWGVPYFSMDNKSLTIAGRDVVGVDIATGKEQYQWRMKRLESNIHMSSVVDGKVVGEGDSTAWRALAISSDGAVAGGILWKHEMVGGRTENRIVLCDGKTGRLLGRLNDSGKATPMLEAVSFSPDGRLFATTDNSMVHLWEVATRKELKRLEGHRDDVTSVSFSLNGRRLATSSGDSTCLIWDIGRIVEADQPLAKPGTAKQIAAWWDDLLSAEPRTAYAAIWRLSEVSKEAIPFLSERLRPVTKEQANRVAQYVTDLDSDKFPVRQKASQELHTLGRMIEPALRRDLEKNPPLETRRRLEQLLNDVYDGPTSGEPLRTARAITVLEYAATPEAKQLLEALARGADGALLTEESRKAVERLRILSHTR